VKGEVLEARDGSLVVRAGGLGLEVRVPEPCRERWVHRGGEVELFAHLHVRENELSLYGCETREEMEMFRLLLEVSGVGPRLALAALSALRLDELRAALAEERAEVLVRVPGVGRRMAERLVLELKGKVTGPSWSPPPQGDISGRSELIDGLRALGYSESEAQAAARSLPAGEAPLEERLREALAYFAGER